MNDVSTETELRRRRLQELLLGHLKSAGVPAWPGADALALDDVLLTYPEAAAAGRVPGYDELLAAYPDLRPQLAALFAAAS
jgi:hypothetical protein